MVSLGFPLVAYFGSSVLWLLRLALVSRARVAYGGPRRAVATDVNAKFSERHLKFSDLLNILRSRDS